MRFVYEMRGLCPALDCGWRSQPLRAGVPSEDGLVNGEKDLQQVHE